jgi:hypothetical protein
MKSLNLLLTWFFESIAWFAWKPQMALAISGVFFIGGLIIILLRLNNRKLSSVRIWPILIPAITWALYSIWEWFCTVKRHNIRVDLILIYPFLIGFSIFGLSVSISSLISSYFKK